MKTNEVPEKIIHNGIEYYRVDIIEEITVDGKIFVKKDAFIEKACQWLYDNLHWADPSDFLEDFKKYMKNE